MRNCLHHPEATKTDFSTLKSPRNNLYLPSFIHLTYLNSQEEQRDISKRKSIKIDVLFLCSFLLFGITILAQQKITGVVTGTNSLPLEGATVAVKSTNIATSTIADGSFSIAAKSGDILVISFVGYKSKQIEVGKETTLKINLSEAVTNLDEIFVTGYSSQKMKEITGSVIVVKPKELTAIPGGQVVQTLQGKVAGLDIIGSGMPGGPINVRLHGIGNFGDVTPLYIIDGVQGNTNNLNPNDIESIQVLKDPAAYSIYGVRGSNGVLVITTLNGKPGKTKISYDFYMSTTRPLKLNIDILDPQEQADLIWIAMKNSRQVGPNGNPNHLLYGNGVKPILPDYFIAGTDIGLFENDPAVNPSLYNIDYTNPPIYQIVKTNKTGTDWFHELFKPAFSHSHSVRVSGANEKNKYFLSFGYLDQQGTVLNTYLKRFTVRVNTQFSINEKTRIGENLQLTYRNNPLINADFNFSPEENDIFRAMIAQPILPVYDIKGGWAHFGSGAFAFFSHPLVRRVLAKEDINRNWEIAGNVFAEVDLIRHFTLRTSFGGSQVNYYFNKYGYFTYEPLSNGLPDNNLVESSGYRRSWTWTNTVTYSRSFHDDHHLTALAGIEAINNYNHELGGKKVGFFTNDVNYRFLTNGSTTFGQSNYSFGSTSTLYSIISQADYNYKGKYLVRGTLRRDGSSVFNFAKRYGWFPSVGAAWRLTEEKFLQQVKWITDLKLRASWGKTGYYGNTDPFNQYTLYGGSIGDAYYDINGSNVPVQGFRMVRIGDPNTGWQEDIATNIGFESVLFNNKLNITVDWYRKKSKGLLIPITLPDVLGGALPPNINVGNIQNKGLDIRVGLKGKWTKDWQWDAALTFTKYNNRVLKLTDLPYYFPFSSSFQNFVRNEVGYPTGSFFGYKIIGIFQDSEEVNKAATQNGAAPGRFRYLDANNDSVISDADRVHTGDPNPKFTLGINLGITYKDFDLSTFFYGCFGNDVLNLPRMSIKSNDLLYNSWTPQNTSATIPIIENEVNFSNDAGINSYMLEKGGYFRTKYVTLGYNLSKPFIQKLKIEKLRVYIQALNLFTITKYSGLDPELSGRSDAFGIDFGNYPNNQKQFLFGINMNF